MEEIIKLCKASVTLSVNNHRDFYQSTKDTIKEINERGLESGNDPDEKEIDDELAERMVKENTIISLQFYPNTPIGFFVVYGTTVKEVEEKALKILKE